MFARLTGRSLGMALTAAFAAVAATAQTASATLPPAQIEQVNRASGAQGEYSLLTFAPTWGFGAITSNGRYSFFSDEAASGYDDPEAVGAPQPVPAPGLHMRDVVTNTTTDIAGSGAQFAGLDRTETVIGFTTTQSLDPADTNGARDLYSYNRLTGARALLSRANGPAGAALGLDSGATLDRNTTTAVFGSGGKVYRRDVLAGTTTVLGDGPFIIPRDDTSPYPFLADAPVDEFASSDGRVYATPAAIVTPKRTVSALTPDGDEPAVNPTVSASGTLAIWQTSQLSLTSVHLANLVTGEITSPAVPASLLGTGNFTGLDGTILRFTPDGLSALVVVLKVNAAGTDFTQSVVQWTFATGAVKDLGLTGGVVSRTGRYALSAGGGGGNGKALVAVAATGSVLPGTLDAPSPHAYVRLSDRCQFGTDRSVILAGDYTRGLPTPSIVRFRVWNQAGALVLDKTQNPFPTGFDPSFLFTVPVGTGSYTTRIDVRLADGRWTNATTHQPAKTCAGAPQ